MMNNRFKLLSTTTITASFVLQTFLIALINLDQRSVQVQAQLSPGVCANFSCRYGECEQFSGNYLCHCFNRVKGPKCDTLLYPSDNLCASNPCWGGGICFTNPENTAWSCQCQNGRDGRNCRLVNPNIASVCRNNQCQNGGVCTVNVTQNNYACICVDGWIGQFCNQREDLCKRPMACYNGGTCDPMQNRCNCLANFTGYQCETFVLPPRYLQIRVTNKGWYIASLELYYQVQNGPNKEGRAESASLLSINSHTFWVPMNAGFDSPTGVNLIVSAVAGRQVLNIRVPRVNQICYETWGTTLFPAWSQMPC